MEARALANDVIGVDVIAKKTAGVYVYAEKQDAYPDYTYSNAAITSGYSETGGLFCAEGIRERAWYVEANQNPGQIKWRASEWDDVRQKTEFSATRTIINTKNLRESLGVIRAFVSTESIRDILNKVKLGDEGEVYLYCGNTLLNYEDSESLSDILMLAGDDEGGMKGVTIGGQPYYMIIRDTGISDWQLLGIAPAGNVNYLLDLLRNIAFVIIVLGLVFTMIISHLIARSVARLLSEIKKSADSQRKSELQALQSQINPHFLYNTLNCISSPAYAKDTPEIADLTLALSEFFRISLNKGNEELPLSREIEHVRSYCAIQQYRSQEPFELYKDLGRCS